MRLLIPGRPTVFCQINKGMNRNISPEEKLLRLIKKKSPSEAQVNAAAVITNKPVVTGRPGRGAFLKSRGRLGVLRIFVISGFILSCLYLAFSFIFPVRGLQKVDASGNLKQGSFNSVDELKKRIKPYEYYSRGIDNNRRIFAAALSEGELSDKDGLKEAVPLDMVKTISLLGIIAGDIPQAIIEDKRSQKTYYLNKWQSLGEFVVDDIQEGKVVLNYKGEKFEVYM